MSSPGQYYKEKMSSYLDNSKLPPTTWELKNQHHAVEAEAMSQSQESLPSMKDEIKKEYKEISGRHRLMREESLINSAIGKKNYVQNK